MRPNPSIKRDLLLQAPDQTLGHNGNSMSSDFPDILQNSVWHMTSIERFKKILKHGAIIAEPPVPDSERWKTQKGPGFYPYVRSIGGISLFQFKNFDPDKYSKKYFMCNWRTFIPYYHGWGASIWIEIDTKKLGRAFVSAEQINKQWKTEQNYNHTHMPKIEAASLKPIPIQYFKRVLRSSARIKFVNYVP